MQAQCERPLQQQGQINECHKKQADDEKATIDEVDSDARKLSQPVQVWMKVKPNLSHQRSQMYAKKNNKHSTITGKWLFIDIRLTTTTSLGGMKDWLVIIHDCTDYTWSCFLRKKKSCQTKLMS